MAISIAMKVPAMIQSASVRQRLLRPSVRAIAAIVSAAPATATLIQGNADPIELYRPGLDDLDEELRASFMGDNMYDCYARMGDPL